MEILHTIADVRAFRAAHPGRLAFVPTMGALHAGHVSLITRARELADVVGVSIFVNPTQFGAGEDFSRYPRPIEADLQKCRDAGAAFVFNPTPQEIYRPGLPDVVIDLPQLTTVLEGRHRPGHFRGVCQVVAKLFNIVEPTTACFGRKDFQQLRVIQAMVDALDWPIRIEPCPTLRDPDGLAMSSRNQYLTPEQRQRALSISRGLFAARSEFAHGVHQTNRLVTTVQKHLLETGSLGHVPVQIDYVAAVDAQLRPVEQATSDTVIAVAARVGSTRLIDNVELGLA